MSKKELIELVNKITAGVATDEEIMQFNKWYHSFQDDAQQWPESDLGDKKQIETMLIRSIDQRINAGPVQDNSAVFRLRRIAVAAILLLLMSGGLYWYLMAHHPASSLPELVISNDVEPGADKAILTTSDGSTILLDEANRGWIASEGNVRVQKAGEGVIEYLEQPHVTETKNPVVYNTISTPRGGQYQVVLPDQTVVWLNALSSIRFPTRFTGPVRSVEMTGEVYFDVAHDASQPFEVRTGGHTVQVLGTEFEVKAYADEQDIRTTLVAGSVRVETAAEQVRIEPGQQVIYADAAPLTVTDVDTDQVTAWKNGIFQFWNTDLDEIMRQLSRWYDVEITYLNERAGMAFTGFISRNVTISNVLQMLEEAGNIEFGLQGRKVMVRTGVENDLQ